MSQGYKTPYVTLHERNVGTDPELLAKAIRQSVAYGRWLGFKASYTTLSGEQWNDDPLGWQLFADLVSLLQDSECPDDWLPRIETSLQ